MATVPGAIVSPRGYGDYMWIITFGEPHVTVVDGARPGPRGRVYGCDELGKAIKVPAEAGRFLTEHCAYTGVVQVEEIDRPDGTGTDLNITAAEKDSLAQFEKGDEDRWQQYMGYVMWKLEKKEIVPPPPEGIQRLMKRRNYRLKDYGIDIMGQAGQPSSGSELAELKALVKALTEQVADSRALIKSQAEQIAELSEEKETVPAAPARGRDKKGR